MPQQTPNVFLFPRDEPGTRGHLDLVEPLRSMPRAVQDALRGVPDRDLAYVPGDGRWGIRQLVAHLADAARIYHMRLYMMSTQTDPILQPYDPDALVQARGDAGSIDDLIAEIRHWRQDTVALLTSLVNWNWARTGQHLESGRLSIRQIVEHMVEHEAEHLEELRRLRVEAASA